MPGITHQHTHVPENNASAHTRAGGNTSAHIHMPESNTSAHTHADELAGFESLSYYFNSKVSSLQALAPNFSPILN